MAFQEKQVPAANRMNHELSHTTDAVSRIKALPIFPGNKLDPEMKGMFTKSGTRYFDYSDIGTKGKMLPFGNAHPSPILYEIVAKRLHKGIASNH